MCWCTLQAKILLKTIIHFGEIVLIGSEDEIVDGGGMARISIGQITILIILIIEFKKVNKICWYLNDERNMEKN